MMFVLGMVLGVVMTLAYGFYVLYLEGEEMKELELESEDG